MRHVLIMFESWTARKCTVNVLIPFYVFRLALDTFVADNFPLKSTEFVRGGPQYNDYIHALDKVHVLCCVGLHFTIVLHLDETMLL